MSWIDELPVGVSTGYVYGLKVNFNKISTSEEGKRDRVRLEVGPYVIGTLGRAEVIFASTGFVVSDPDFIQPSRPEGHCYEVHMPSTSRWDPVQESELVVSIREVAEMSESIWAEANQDDGSVYYYSLIDGAIWRKQVAKSSGRTMIGQIFEVHWEVWDTELGRLQVTSLLQKRMVTSIGTDTNRSPVWSTQYAFAGWLLG